MRNESDNIEIRKLTIHVNNRPINVLAPVKVPRAKYTALRAIHEQGHNRQQAINKDKKQSKQEKITNESQKMREEQGFYEGAKLK